MKESALEVVAGVDGPPEVNPRGFVRRRRGPVDAGELFGRIRQGDRGALAQGITYVESSLAAHRAVAGRLLDLAVEAGSRSVRVGVTGVPGVGKSTLIEALGLHVLGLAGGGLGGVFAAMGGSSGPGVGREGGKLAVLAVDPSSASSGGSILGDKSRMTRLSAHPRTFIRPSPAGRSLGGVAHATREAISLVEAAGYDVVFVETVGVGQSEHAVHRLVDCFLLLMLAGAGDELQGIKRGVMEMADVVAVTKADGENLVRARVARQQALNALRFLAGHGRMPEVRCVSVLEGAEGLAELWGDVVVFLEEEVEGGGFTRRRADQAVGWMEDLVREEVFGRAMGGLGEVLARAREEVRAGRLTPRSGAEMVLGGGV